VPGGDVEELFRGLWLLAAALVHQGLVSRARPERRYSVDVAYLWEFMAFLGEMPNVILQGLPLFLSTTLQIPRVARPYVRALEITGKYIIEIVPAIDRVFGQVIELCSGHVGQVDGEELNDEQVAIRPIYSACEAVIL
jgi:hypothetical protein